MGIWGYSYRFTPPLEFPGLTIRGGGKTVTNSNDNFATIGPILEILDVLESPDHVRYIFDTFMR